MSSSELNNFIVSTDRVVRLDQMVLDVRKLDQTIVGGKSAYDAIDLTYDANASTYDGTLTEYSYANSAFGGLTASVNAIPIVKVSANASLGNLVSTAISLPKVIVTATAQLGALNASITANVTDLVSANANLGTINTQSTAIVKHLANAQSQLGSLIANANTIPQVLPLFNAQFGALSANASSLVTDVVGANANLGTITANANATVIHPEPPAPEPTFVAGHYRPFIQPPIVEPTPVIEPPKVVITETPKAKTVREIQRIVANAHTNPAVLTAKAQSKIEWSILDDEAELLLLL